jgi:O-antigen/teichoic acid export membrane protein
MSKVVRLLSSKPSGRFASNVRWQLVANGAQTLFGGAYLVVLGRYLGASDFGVFSIIMALIGVAGQMIELRLQDVVARDFCHIDEEAPRCGDEGARLVDLLVLELMARLLPCLGLVLLSPILIEISRLPPHAAQLLMLAAAGFFFSKSGWGVSTGLLRVLGRTDKIALCLSIDWGLRLLVTTALALAGGLSIESVLVIVLVVGGLLNAIQLVLAWREFDIRLGPIPWRQWRLSEALQRSTGNRRLIAANLGISISDLMAKDLDIAMISSMLTADKVGLYKMAKSFVQVVWRAIDPFYLAIMPEVQKLWLAREDGKLVILLRRTSFRLFILSLCLVTIAFALVALFGELVLGTNYAGLQWLMLFMSTWIVFCAPLVWGLPLAIAIGRPELAIGGSLIGSVVGLTAFLALTPAFGLNGAAFAWVLTLMVGFAFTSGLAAWIGKYLRTDVRR